MLLSEIAKSDAKISYHSTLSTKLWDGFELKSDVLKALRKISKSFIDTLEINDNAVSDIIITGSMCNYNYTKFSDIDLHIVVDYSAICDDCEEFSLDDCMLAQKSLWNERHDITIYDIDVELYVQDVKTKITGNVGVFSIMDNKWVKRPKKEKTVEYDSKLIEKKAKQLMKEIDNIIDNKDTESKDVERMQERIRNLRKASLEKYGELGVENLVFKVLRNSGYLDKLYSYKIDVQDSELSLS